VVHICRALERVKSEGVPCEKTPESGEAAEDADVRPGADVGTGGDVVAAADVSPAPERPEPDRKGLDSIVEALDEASPFHAHMPKDMDYYASPDKVRLENLLGPLMGLYMELFDIWSCTQCIRAYLRGAGHG
jgi:hypothetical protein